MFLGLCNAEPSLSPPLLRCRCDFTPIYEWQMAEREKKKGMSKEVRPCWACCTLLCLLCPACPADSVFHWRDMS